MALSTAKRVFFIVTIVCFVAMLILVADYYRIGAATLQSPVTGERITNTIGILLYLGQTIGNQIQALTEYHLLALGSYVVQTNAGRTRARQFLRFSNGFAGGSLVFKQAEIGRATSDFLTFMGDMPMFEYETVFDSGFSSEIVDNRDLEDYEGEQIMLMGLQYTVLEAKIDKNSGTVKIKLIGPGGLVEFEDQYGDTSFSSRVEVNGKTVYAEVMIIGAPEGRNEFGIYNIRYRPKPYQDLDVAPRHGLRGSMREPEKLLNPFFNMFYLGLRSGAPTTSPAGPMPSGPGVIEFDARGDDQYQLGFTTKEATYQIPLITLRGGTMVWGDEDKDFIFKESQKIYVNDYFLVTSRKNNINARSNILVFDRMDFANKIVYIRDWRGGTKTAKFDSTGKGSFIAGGHTYKIQVDMANAQHPIQVDDGDGDFSDTFDCRLMDGTVLEFSGAGTVKYRVPRRLFEDRTSDEVATIQITKSGGDLRLTVTSPALISSGRGRKEAMMDYGARFFYEDSDIPEELTIAMPGSAGGYGGGMGFSTGTGQGQGGLLVTFEENVLRQRQMERQQELS